MCLYSPEDTLRNSCTLLEHSLCSKCVSHNYNTGVIFSDSNGLVPVCPSDRLVEDGLSDAYSDVGIQAGRVASLGIWCRSALMSPRWQSERASHPRQQPTSCTSRSTCRRCRRERRLITRHKAQFALVLGERLTRAMAT